MAITPTQWSHVLTIPESYIPSASTTGQTLLITEAVIAKLSPADQTVFWSNVQNGGGDVRICTDLGGANQLPVADADTVNTTAETCAIRTRKVTYDGTSSLYVFLGKAGETQPVATDPFGRNAVWQDDTYRQGADGVTDVTGSTTISLNSQAVLNGSVNGFNAVEFNATSGTCAIFDGSQSDNFTGDFTLSAWINADILNNGFANILGIRINSAWEFSFRLENNQPAMLIGNASPNSTGVLSVSTDYLLHATVSGSLISFFLNGSPIGTATVSGSRQNRSEPLTFGGVQDGSASGTTFNGFIAEARAVNGTAISSAKVATEYANQSDPATFFGQPTIAETGGATGVTADVAYTIAAPTFASTASVTLPQPIADAAFTINAPTFAATASATTLGFNASVSFAIPAPTFSADATVTLPNPTADVSYTIAAPTFSVNADATLPQPSSDVAFTVNSPSFAVTATATEPNFNASVNFTVSAPTFAVDATATLPQPSADAGFAVSAPTFSVVAIVGGIAIIVDEETNINQRVLSNNINAPILSTNING